MNLTVHGKADLLTTTNGGRKTNGHLSPALSSRGGEGEDSAEFVGHIPCPLRRSDSPRRLRWRILRLLTSAATMINSVQSSRLRSSSSPTWTYRRRSRLLSLPV